VTRILLTTILPLLLPFVVYGLWLVFARRRARLAAQGRSTLLVRVPWMALLLSGLALAAISLLYFRATSGTDPWRDHRPPAVRDGVVVPGGVR
jgi:hypothetical protein